MVVLSSTVSVQGLEDLFLMALNGISVNRTWTSLTGLGFRV